MKMCEDEVNGMRPIHRPREWKEKEGRLEKGAKVTNWHKSKPDQVPAPLIFDPTAGSLRKDAKDVCRKFEQVWGWWCRRGQAMQTRPSPNLSPSKMRSVDGMIVSRVKLVWKV